MHPVRSSVKLNVNLQPCVTSEGIDYSPVSVAKKTHSADIGKRFQLLGWIRKSCQGSYCAHSSCLRMEDVDYARSLLLNSEMKPGDYHRFHSPADWSIHMRRHFPDAWSSVQRTWTRTGR
ncbi:unnamed protein product [Dicrocoelium dendriticum]|nr:unnamed protein product [Dicrocoelium dendriticum]